MKLDLISYNDFMLWYGRIGLIVCDMRLKLNKMRLNDKFFNHEDAQDKIDTIIIFQERFHKLYEDSVTLNNRLGNYMHEKQVLMNEITKLTHEIETLKKNINFK